MGRGAVKKGKIALVIPVFNEEGKTLKFIPAIPSDWVDEVVIIDDGSTDKTAAELSSAGAAVLHHKNRLGIGAAIRTGINYALKNQFDIIAVMAGNGKDDPAQIPRLLEPILKDNYDYVQGSRYLAGGRHGKMPLHRLLFTRLYSLAVWILTGFRLTDGTNGFRAYRASIFKDKRINIGQPWLNESLEYYLSIKVIKLGLRVKEVPVAKIYPQRVSYNSYTKVKPLIGWWCRLKPLFYLTLRIKV